VDSKAFPTVLFRDRYPPIKNNTVIPMNSTTLNFDKIGSWWFTFKSQEADWLCINPYIYYLIRTIYRLK